MCVFNMSTTFVSNISHSKKNWARYKNIYIGLHIKYPLLLSDLNSKLEFSEQNFEKILEYNMWK
jgi:hypothetical protein